MSETRPNPKHTKIKQSAVTGRCLHKLAHSLALLLSRTLFYLMLSAAVLLFLLRLLLLLMCILWPRAAFAAVCICSCRRRRTLCFCQKFPSLLIIDFRSLPVAAPPPSLSPLLIQSMSTPPLTTSCSFMEPLTLQLLRGSQPNPHRCWLWRLRAVQLGGFKPALIRCKLQSMRK